MAENQDLTWEQAGIADETVTEKDIKAAEGLGMLPPGKYLCRVVESKPRQRDFNAYSCMAAGLKMEVVKVLQINGKPPEGDAAEALEGKYIFDDVNLASPKEKEKMRDRRVMVAKRIGIIPPDSKRDYVIEGKAWGQVVGKQVIVSYIHEPSKKNDGKVYGNVDFNGYEHISMLDRYTTTGQGATNGAGPVSVEDTADI